MKPRPEAEITASGVTAGGKGLLVEGKVTDTASIRADAGGLAIAVGTDGAVTGSAGVSVAINEITGLDGATGGDIGALVENTAVTSGDPVGELGVADRAASALVEAEGAPHDVGQHS